jgi:hypothetical protein
MDKTVVALFDNLDTAQTAVKELLNNGFARDDISVVRTNQQGDYTSGNTVEPGEGDASGAAAGAGIGAVLGGLAGLLVGLGALAIPGIGPIIAAGPIATTLAGAGIGAATGGLVGALADTGIPEKEAGAYAEGVRRGGTLVTVRANADEITRATEVLNRFTPVDINQRAGEWQSSGWSGYDANAGPYDSPTDAADAEQANMPVGSDQTGMAMTAENDNGTYGSTGSTGYTGTGTSSAGLGSGSARRFEDYDPEFRIDWESNYRDTGFGYERYQPAYQYGWQLGEQYRGQEWNDFVAKARADWERSHPDDAWHDFQDAIRRGWDRSKEGAQDTAASMHLSLQQMGETDLGYQSDQGRRRGQAHQPDQGYDRTVADMSRGFATYDPDFRGDWERSFRSTGYGYERYQPAYQYGYNLATEPRYRGQQWNDVESEARRDWETRHPNDAWEDFKAAVQHAWDRVRGGAHDTQD